MKKLIVALFGTLLLAAPLATHAQSVTNFVCITNLDGTLAITGYTGTNGIIAIPASISNMTVAVIGDGSDSVFGGIATNVTIPGTVTTIAANAFNEEENLTNLSVPDSVTSIGVSAFSGCSSLPGVNIPNGVTIIQAFTFSDCLKMTNVTLPPSVNAIEFDAFQNCTNLDSFVIPPTVTEIREDAFSGAAMVNLTIGTNAPTTNVPCSLDGEAFESISVRSNLVIGTSVWVIGENAFSGSVVSNNLTIGANGTEPGMTVIDDSAFSGVTNIAALVIGNSVINISKYAFNNCSASNITIGDNTEIPGGACAILDKAFYQCYATSVTIGRSVNAIGRDAFYASYPMSNVTVLGGAIGVDAFDECGIASLYIGTNVTGIGDSAFEDCGNLATAYIGGGSIGDDAFNQCNSLSNLVFGPNVTAIGEYAFNNCYSLRDLILPDNISGLEEDSFASCINLTNVTIGSGIKEIALFAFSGDTALTDVTIGAGVTSLGLGVFDGDTNLQNVYFQGNLPNVNPDAFNGMTAPTAYYFTGGTGFPTNLLGMTVVETNANSLTVTLGPSSAIAAGASWTLDGGAIYTSSATLNNLAPGAHTVTFASIDGWTTPANQTVSVTNAVTVNGLYIPTNTAAGSLTILINGHGSASVSGSPKTFVGGKTYKATAAPAPGNLFESWQEISNQTTVATSSSVTLSFIYQPNIVLVASFVTNPFIAVSGTYNGLFSGTNGVTAGTAGMLSALTISAKGSYSGKLLINNGSYSVTGSFDTTGAASNNIVRKASLGGNLTLNMTISTTDGSTPEITGTVSNATFTSQLLAEEAANALPSAEYAMLILPDTNSLPPTNSPGGAGYVLITNNAGTVKNPGSANVKLTGGLADGTTFSQTVPVSADGYVPVYSALSGKGLLTGWINLTLTNTTGVSLTWIRDAATKGIYTNGFTNTLTPDDLPISTWSHPTNLTSLVALFVEPSIGQSATTNQSISVSAAGKITGGATGTIDLKTGLIKLATGTGASKISAYGAFLPDLNYGDGYFVTRTNAQGIQIYPIF